MKIRTNTKNSSKKSLEAGAQKTAQRKKEKKTNVCSHSLDSQCYVGDISLKLMVNTTTQIKYVV